MSSMIFDQFAIRRIVCILLLSLFNIILVKPYLLALFSASLPWGLNIVLFPIMMVATLVFVFVLFLFITKPRFKLSLPMFSIELGEAERHREPIRMIRGGKSRRRVRFLENNDISPINEVEYKENLRVEEVSLDNSDSSSAEEVKKDGVHKKEKLCSKNNGSEGDTLNCDDSIEPNTK